MSIEAFYDKTALVERLTAVSGKHREDWQTVEASVACQVQPYDGADSGAGEFFRKFKLYAAHDADIANGDRVTVDGDVYRVEAVKVMDFVASSNRHVEAVLLLGR